MLYLMQKLHKTEIRTQQNTVFTLWFSKFSFSLVICFKFHVKRQIFKFSLFFQHDKNYYYNFSLDYVEKSVLKLGEELLFLFALVLQYRLNLNMRIEKCKREKEFTLDSFHSFHSFSLHYELWIKRVSQKREYGNMGKWEQKKKTFMKSVVNKRGKRKTEEINKEIKKKREQS